MDDLLKKLLLTPGVSGCESEIGKVVSEELSHFGTISRDKLGSVICHIKGTVPDKERKKIMISAHIDHLALFVRQIQGSGLISCVSFGYNPDTSNHQPVVVLSSKGSLPGLMNAKEEGKKNVFTIDIGAKSDQETAELGVQIGDPIILAGEPFTLYNERICSPRLDNRLGTYELILLGQEIKTPKHDVYLVGTVGEEVGLRGAQTSSFIIDPDIAFVFDITYDDLPVRMGAGPTITLSDKSVIIPPSIRDLVHKFAQKYKIPVQFEIWDIGGTDAGKILVSRGGVPVIPILTPIKHAHTPYEIGCLVDCHNVVKLTKVLIENIESLLEAYSS